MTSINLNTLQVKYSYIYLSSSELGISFISISKTHLCIFKISEKTFSCRSWIPMPTHNIFLHKNDKDSLYFFRTRHMLTFLHEILYCLQLYMICVYNFFPIVLECKAYFLYKFSIWSHTFNYSLSLYCFCCLMPKGTQGCCSAAWIPDWWARLPDWIE